VGTLQAAQARLAKAGLPEAMADAHALSGALRSMAAQAPDDVTRAYLSRVSAGLRQDLGSEAFGTAGQLYRAATAEPSRAALGIADQQLLRGALRDTTTRGQLGGLVSRENEALVRALDAQEALTGVVAPKGLANDLRRLELLTAKAEDAVTLDGGPLGRIVPFFAKKAENKVENAIENAVGGAIGGVIGGFPGAATGALVAPILVKRLMKVAGALRGAHLPALSQGAQRAVKSGAAFLGKTTESTTSELVRGQATGSYLSAASRPTERKEQLEQFRERFEAVQQLAMRPDHEAVTEAVDAMARIAPGIEGQAAAEMGQKFAQLFEDMPKPGQSIRGGGWDSLSSKDLQLSRAMWEATTDPLSVFDDLAAGDLDPDKTAYAFKQYPGLKMAAQAGLADILFTQMSEEERADIPEQVLTQVDSLFDMQGALQETRSPAFLATIEQVAQQMAKEQQKAPKRGMLELPSARPTPMARIAAGRA
jgi:hypothetical protein